MITLNEGQSIEVKGSGKKPYVVKNVGGVISCSCPAWLNQSVHIDKRTCKHIKANVSNGYNPDGPTWSINDTIVLDSFIPPKVEAKVVVAPPVMLAHDWDLEQDITGWMISPKLDGVRAVFDGKRFVSRNGNELFAPQWFIDNVVMNVQPALFEAGYRLDGELWAGNGNFQMCVSAVKKYTGIDTEWKQISYQVFELIQPENSTLVAHQKTAKYRYGQLKDFVTPKPGAVVAIVSQVALPSMAHVEPLLKALMEQGYEGIMAKNPNAEYKDGRSSDLLKIKKFHDAEALVLEHIPGKGKHKGKMGAILCQLDNGNTFEIGTGFTDKERENPPKVGAKVTFKYQEFTKDGKPRFPVYMRPFEKV